MPCSAGGREFPRPADQESYVELPELRKSERGDQPLLHALRRRADLGRSAVADERRASADDRCSDGALPETAGCELLAYGGRHPAAAGALAQRRVARAEDGTRPASLSLP